VENKGKPRSINTIVASIKIEKDSGCGNCRKTDRHIPTSHRTKNLMSDRRRPDRYPDDANNNPDRDRQNYSDEFDDDPGEFDDGYREFPPRLTTRAPRVPRWRRGCAFAIDFLIAGFFCALLSNENGFGQFITFNFGWLAIRAIVVSSNYGQSPGRWLFDMRVIDARYQRTPLLGELFKREAIAGNGAFLAFVGLTALGSQNAFYLLFLVPIALDVGAAWIEPNDPAAFHDRLAGTAVVATRRGYSLDLKLKKWVAFGMANMKR
jgi:uncharacterized RDD family membrane protein YckC